MEISDRYHSLNAAIYPWFEEQWQRVLRLHNDNHLPHALLLSGMPGIGKARLAESIAGYVMCHQPQTNSACGQCRSCVLLNSSGHPDLYFLRPEEKGKPIKVDQVRQLTEFMHNTAQQGGYRVVVLEPAESMNISAANALLKTLEEPGRDTLLILITHQLGQVLPTVKSRCQRLDCHPPDETVAVEWLVEALSVEYQEALQLLKVVHGAPLAGVDFKQQGHQALRADFLTALRDILRQRKSPPEVAGQFLKADLDLLLGWLQGLLADITRILLMGSDELVRNKDMQKMLKGVAKNSTKDKIFTLADLIQFERLGLQRRQNPNKQLLLERILIDWSALVRT
ncbi:DNA polymerase III subunit delta' [Neptunomonas japonica]|uniref:DNA polymerase III subunit delta' n=1 Tax=Neptunomonas japonica JAMM 1380 TaxID=1441457 RepID=A0A7R6SVE4_9GAMM|nr:DNA polymerase III subunit delta' [Neptunomonas japonica]BBB29311.1 DNA polymerase III subunit delta' [Neptunomonas japonica JAMM 1380]